MGRHLYAWRSKDHSLYHSFIRSYHSYHSFHVTSRHVPSRPVPSRPIPSRPVPSRPVPSRHVTSRHVTSRHHAVVSSCHHLIMSSCHFIPFHSIPFHSIRSFSIRIMHKVYGILCTCARLEPELSFACNPGATLGGQAGHYPTPAVTGMSSGVVRKTLTLPVFVLVHVRCLSPIGF